MTDVRRRMLAALWIALPALSTGSFGQTDVKEEVTVDRVVWPVFVSASRSEGSDENPAPCQIGPDEIRITENGVEVDVKSLDRESRPIIHVLLIDTSGSMRPNIEQVKEAAVLYVDSLTEQQVAQDSMAVFTFHNDLIMESRIRRLADAGATESIKAAIRGISVKGMGTNLEEALFHVKLFLGSQPMRSVLIVLSDGRSASVAFGRQAQVRYAEHVDNLIMFAIGLDDARRSAADYLSSLAEVTGGRYYQVGKVSGVRKTFLDIRREVSQIAFVSYEAKRGRSDRGAVNAPRGENGTAAVVGTSTAGTVEASRTEVQIRLSTKDCRIRYPRYRRLNVDPSDVFQGTGDLTEVTLLTVEEPAGMPTFGAEQNVLTATLSDIVVDAGPLFRKLRTIPAETGKRRIAITFPYWSTCLPSPQERPFLAALEEWLSRDSRSDETLINGRSFVTTRMQLAKHIADVPGQGYGVFAEGALRARIEGELRASLEGRTATLDLDATIRTALEERIRNPTAEDLRSRYVHLVDWLGDVRVFDVAEEWEIRAINGLIRPDGRDSSARIPFLELWKRLYRTFGFARSMRIVAPMWLFWDAGDEEFGFYRLVLPSRMEDDVMPIHPFAYLIARRLTAGDGLEITPIVGKRPPAIHAFEEQNRLAVQAAKAALAGGVAERVRYRSVSTKQLSAAVRKVLKTHETDHLVAVLVTIEIAPRSTADPGGAAERFEIVIGVDRRSASWQVYCAQWTPLSRAVCLDR